MGTHLAKDARARLQKEDTGRYLREEVEGDLTPGRPSHPATLANVERLRYRNEEGAVSDI